MAFWRREEPREKPARPAASSTTSAPTTDLWNAAAPRGAQEHGDSFGWGDEAAPAVGASTMAGDETLGQPSILVVCTGNVCRSPYIERRLAHALRGSGVRVSSAGTGALVGRPIEPGSARLLDAAGVASGHFAARQLTERMVSSADLVLTATREHRREVVQFAPVGLRKTFTVHDFADLVAGLDASAVQVGPGQNVIAQLVATAESRRGIVSPRVGDEADIVDPYRRGEEVFAQMQAQADPSIDVIAAVLQ